MEASIMKRAGFLKIFLLTLIGNKATTLYQKEQCSDITFLTEKKTKKSQKRLYFQT